jgi:glycosyltransferase involved in cell wall biosynthesis
MSTGDVPLVSIITPAYNSARYLPDLLRSVSGQSYARIEHVIIDDGSDDDGATVRLLERQPGVRWWSRRNVGQYATMNEGVRAATGEFVTLISADDFYVDGDAVGALARCLIDHPECDVAYGFTLHVNDAGQPLPVQPYQRYPPWMLRYNPGFIFHCSLLVRRTALLRDDCLFDESVRFVGDAEWMIRLSKRYRFLRIDRCIGAYRHHDDQTSSQAARDERADARRRNEHTWLHQRHGTGHVMKALVGTYNTFHQRRVKALTAWRRGGSRQVLTLASGWIERKYGRK